MHAPTSPGDGPAVTLHLNRLDEWDALGGAGPLLRRAIRLTLSEAGADRAGEISVTCLPAPEIEALNRRFLDRDGPTDVIAFELGEGGRLLGDVYVCPDVARSAAREVGIELEEEMVRLVVHGVLHVLGHDHPEDEGRWESRMFRLQERLVARALKSG